MFNSSGEYNFYTHHMHCTYVLHLDKINWTFRQLSLPSPPPPAPICMMPKWRVMVFAPSRGLIVSFYTHCVTWHCFTPPVYNQTMQSHHYWAHTKLNAHASFTSVATSSIGSQSGLATSLHWTALSTTCNSRYHHRRIMTLVHILCFYSIICRTGRRTWLNRSNSSLS